MPSYKIDNDRVLIIPGFTDQELLTECFKRSKTRKKR